MGARLGIVLSAWLVLLLTASAAQAQAGDQQVYFLAIGQEHYLAPEVSGASRFQDIEGANDSADLVAEELRKGGAAFGIVLQTTDTAAVTVKDVDQALERLLAQIAADHPVHPLLVYYFAGHGLSEGLASLHFSIPGDLTYAGDAEALKHQPDFADRVLDTNWLETRLEKAKVPFLLLLDNCRSAKTVEVGHVDNGVLTDVAARNVTGIIEALKSMGSFRGTNPVLFSTVPGTEALTVPNPDNDQLSLAPLARRFLLLSRDRAERHAPVSLGEFIWTMQSRDFDPELDDDGKSMPFAVTRARWGPTWDRRFLGDSPTVGARIIRLTGSGTAASFCCLAQKAQLPRRMTGSISIAGFSGDFIADGKTWSFVASKTPITLLQEKDGTLHFEIEDPGGSWTLDLAPAQGTRLAPGTFAKIGRSGFQKAAQLGLSLSSPGRGCNDVHGTVTLKQVRYDAAGKVTAISGSAQHLCEDDAKPVVLTIDLESASSP